MAGQPVMQHAWLSTVIFAVIERGFGLEGIILLCALVIATTFHLVFRLVRGEGHFLITAVLVVLWAIVTSMVHWLARPHIFTFLLLILWLTALTEMRRGKLKRWWVLPVLMVFWVNLHGGFIVGFLVWFIYGIGVAWDYLWFQKIDENKPVPKFWCHYLLGGVTAFLSSLANPLGIRLWGSVTGHLGNQYLADITVEFQSPNFHQFSAWPFLIYILLLLLVLAWRDKKPDSGLFFVTAAGLALGLYSGRYIPLFAIVAAPLLASSVDDVLSQAADRLKGIKKFTALDLRLQKVDHQLKGFLWPLLAVLVAVLGLALGFHFDSEGQGYALDPEVFPIEAVDWLENNPQEGEMFNHFTWGGYLQYRLWPESRVFIDSKSDFYGEDFVRQYLQIISLEEGWADRLKAYDVAWAILPSDQALARALHAELGWEAVYEDSTAVILQKQ